MFLINDEPVRFADPWDQPFSRRLENLKRGSPRVAYFYERPDNSTFRYRVYNMIQALRAAESPLSASYFCLDDLAYEDEIIDNCDALVLCRTRYSDAVNRLVTKSRGRGRKTFFDVDDLVFDARFTHLIINTLDQDLAHPQVWDFWFAYTSRLGATLQLCENAIVTNDFLAERVRAFNSMPTSIVPNFLNLEQLGVSDTVYEMKRANAFARNRTIHLGYFSGTPTHNRDFGLIAETISRLLKQDRRLVLRGVGYFQIPDVLASYKDRIEIHPFRDFISLQKLIGSTEINLVPLQDNVFTNCKSELKYFEAGIVGTVTVASPTAVFRRAIGNGVTGFLANTFAWEDRIHAILDDFGSYPQIAGAARDHVRRTYHWSAQAKAIQQALFG